MNPRLVRSSTTLLAAALFASFVAAEDEEERPVVRLPSEWVVGTRLRFEMTKEREETRGETRTGGSRTPVTIEVREKTSAGYILRWTYGKSEAIDAASASDPMAARLANIVEGLALDIRIGADGMSEGLANSEAVIAFYDRVFDALRKEMTKAEMPAEKLEQVMRGLEPARSPETVETLALRDPTMFFLVCGGEFRLGEKREYEDRLPNPFGGAPFPSRAHFLLKEIRDGGSEALVEWRQTLEPEKAREILLATFRAMAERMGTPPPDEKDLPTFSIVDEALFVMEVATGWPRSVTWKRTTLSGPAKRVERTLFMRQPPESK